MPVPARAPIGVGIVGLGFGARVLVPAFRRDPRCRVAAICASERERAQAAADKLAIPSAYGDWRALVADPALDIIAVAVPPPLQPAIAMAAAQAGKHLFCEKPVAADLSQAHRLLSTVRRFGVSHRVDFEFRAAPAWRQAKAWLEKGALGRFSHGLVSWQIETYASRQRVASWKTRSTEGGGALNLFVSHVFDYLEWLCGPVQQVSARLHAIDYGDGFIHEEAVVAMVCLLSDGSPITVAVSQSAHGGSGHRVELYGSEGALALINHSADYISGFRLFRAAREDEALRPLGPAPREALKEDGRIAAVAGLAAGLLGEVRGENPAAPSLVEGCRVQALLEAARRSHETGGWVETSALSATSPGTLR